MINDKDKNKDMNCIVLRILITNYVINVSRFHFPETLTVIHDPQLTFYRFNIKCRYLCELNMNYELFTKL